MKKLLFALPFLALALTFTFCDRPGLPEESLNPQNIGASDRGVFCNVQFDRASPTALTICGTNLNATSCSTCVGGKGVGLTTIPAGTSPFFLNLMAPLEISISSATGNSVTVTTAGGQVTVFIPGGDCKRIRIDDTCSPTVI